MSYIGNTPDQQSFTPAVDYFNGNGSTTAFTLSRPVASVAQVQVAIENVPQNPGSAFTVSGNTITFTSAPPSGTSNIYVYYTSPITQVIAPSDGTVGTSVLASNSVTQAKLGTNVAGNGPAFNAAADGTQAISSGSYTKILFPTEVFDTNNNFASSRFTPTVAGYYLISTAIVYSTTGETVVALYKNGSLLYYLADQNATLTYALNGSVVIYLNGSTDYVEIYAYQSSGSNKTPNTSSFFSGALVRAA